MLIRYGLGCLLALLLWPAQGWGAVTFEVADHSAVFGGSSVSTAGVTIAGTNRASIVTLILSNNAVTGITCSVGGTGGTVVSGTDSGTAHTRRTIIYAVIAPPTGGQSTSCSWTGTSDGFLGMLQASSVNQATPVNNGTFTTQVASTTCSLSITSTSGDLTGSAVYGNISATTNQTERWQTYANVRGDTGPGSGTATHTWTDTSGNIVCVGANFNQLATSSPGNLIMLGIGR